MRVVLRAWREAADGDGVRRVGHGALGHRLTFATGKSRWHDEPGPGRELSGSWQMRVLGEWYRLVRATTTLIVTTR